jgi:hypothetical protein
MSISLRVGFFTLDNFFCILGALVNFISFVKSFVVEEV